MKIGVKNRTRTKTIIILLYILLFSYAAISKILDFENFQVQLGQSHLLSAFAFEVFYLVPFAEIIIVLALLKSNWHYFGFLYSLILMTLFSSYIFIVLYYFICPLFLRWYIRKNELEQLSYFQSVFCILSHCCHCILSQS